MIDKSEVTIGDIYSDTIISSGDINIIIRLDITMNIVQVYYYSKLENDPKWIYGSLRRYRVKDFLIWEEILSYGPNRIS